MDLCFLKCFCFPFKHIISEHGDVASLVSIPVCAFLLRFKFSGTFDHLLMEKGKVSISPRRTWLTWANCRPDGVNLKRVRSGSARRSRDHSCQRWETSKHITFTKIFASFSCHYSMFLSTLEFFEFQTPLH